MDPICAIMPLQMVHARSVLLKATSVVSALPANPPFIVASAQISIAIWLMNTMTEQILKNVLSLCGWIYVSGTQINMNNK